MGLADMTGSEINRDLQEEFYAGNKRLGMDV